MLLMLLPAVIYVVIFCYIPMGGIVIAFKNYNYTDGIFNSPWVGLDNFKYMIISNKLWPLTRNTLLYNLAFISIGTVFQLVLAVFLSEMNLKWVKKFAQSSMLLPYFISWVVVSSIMLNIFGYENGVVNNILNLLHMQPIDVYSNAKTWPIVMIVLNQWKNAGYGSIIYMAAIMGIDQSIYEAADIDGASIWERIRYITLPSVKPTVI
ncbi:MAG: sugar ABC transporter permease, partial [Clostridiales bacterium]|nr:sugar ABC transporter permease [Clostridiales bacterium]